MNKKEIFVGARQLKSRKLRAASADLLHSDEWEYINVVKGLDNFISRDYEAIDGRSIHSIYWEWYNFARLSKIFWYSFHTKLMPIDERYHSVCKDFVGALENGVFSIWTMKYIRSLFTETRRYQPVAEFDPNYDYSVEKRESYLFLAIPLSLPKKYILPQILNHIARIKGYQSERYIDVVQTSKYPLHTMRYNLNVLERERAVFVYKTLYPDLPLWKIADRLQLAPNNIVRNISHPSSKNEEKNRLNSIAGRHLYKANRRLLNLERGSFPNSEPIDIPDGHMPFGYDSNADYIKETSAFNKNGWYQWVFNEYHPWLCRSVIRQNNLDKKNVDMVLLAEFMQGNTDQLPLKK